MLRFRIACCSCLLIGCGLVRPASTRNAFSRACKRWSSKDFVNAGVLALLLADLVKTCACFRMPVHSIVEAADCPAAEQLL